MVSYKLTQSFPKKIVGKATLTRDGTKMIQEKNFKSVDMSFLCLFLSKQRYLVILRREIKYSFSCVLQPSCQPPFQQELRKHVSELSEKIENYVKFLKSPQSIYFNIWKEKEIFDTKILWAQSFHGTLQSLILAFEMV